MKNKTTIGLGLLAVAAAAAWYYWRQRTTTAATDATAAKPDSPFNRTGQIGSNFSTDITPEVVKLALGYSQAVQAEALPCWALRKAGGPYDYYCPKGAYSELECAWVVAGTYPQTSRPC